MGARDEPTLDRACDLGLAFQLTNIARDIIDDAAVGRCYLPEQWLEEMNVPRDQVAGILHRPAVTVLGQRLVELAEPYYTSAEAGLAALPWRSAWAVATAAAVYRQIGMKVLEAGEHAWDERISTSKAEKIGAVSIGLWRAVTSRFARWPARSAQLWQRPRPSCAAGHRASGKRIRVSRRAVLRRRCSVRGVTGCTVDRRVVADVDRVACRVERVADGRVALEGERGVGVRHGVLHPSR
jgi:phytoene synthase